MEFYERVSGARLHAAYVRPGGVALVRLYHTLTDNSTYYMINQDCHRSGNGEG